jgi:transcriptional regulator with XRE-family HTH domain
MYDASMPRSRYDPDKKPAEPLGRALRQARELKGISLRKAAIEADISPAYLSQLEAGEVKEPSPRVLFALAHTFTGPRSAAVVDLYASLMRETGYFVPGERFEVSNDLALGLPVTAFQIQGPDQSQAPRRVEDKGGPSQLEAALRQAGPLTPEEQEALIEYLSWYRWRHQRKQNAEETRPSGGKRLSEPSEGS